MTAGVRIAVLSDTHDRLPAHVLTSAAKADEIWHLGDVCSPLILENITQLGRPLRVVRGNCDSFTGWPLTLDFDLEGFQIRLVHIPPRTPPSGRDLLFHGHTHVPRDEVIGATRFLNPGCITRPNFGAPASFAWLELRRDAPLNWTLEMVAR